ncbi:MAG: arsenate reductase [Pseudomonadota bacterium]
MSGLTLYGILNSDNCRKAWRWLDSHDVAYRFHDVRADGLDAAQLDDWFARSDWQQLVNRRSTTWRGLSAAERDGLDRDSARALLLAHPTLLRRPVADSGDGLEVGFSPDVYAARFAPGAQRSSSRASSSRARR